MTCAWPCTCKCTQLTVFSSCQMPWGVIWSLIYNFHLSFWHWTFTFSSGEALVGVVPPVVFHPTHTIPNSASLIFSTQEARASFTLKMHIQGQSLDAVQTTPVSSATTQLEANKRLTQGRLSVPYKIRDNHKTACVNAARDQPSADTYQPLKRYKLE